MPFGNSEMQPHKSSLACKWAHWGGKKQESKPKSCTNIVHKQEQTLFKDLKGGRGDKSFVVLLVVVLLVVVVVRVGGL